MTLREAITYLARRLRLQHLIRAVLLGLFVSLLSTGRVCGAEEPVDPYDVLYDVIMTRWKDGKAYAQNETSPAIFDWSEFPFGDKAFKKFDAALDAFAALPQEKIESYSDVKRALLQRHLWEVFDTTFNWDWWEKKPTWGWEGRTYFPKTHMDRRKAMQPRLASLIRRLALTQEQILALPNPLAVTVKSGRYASQHNPEDRFKPFLPDDLYDKNSSFVCVGEDRREIPVAQHTGKLYARSMFLQFMRVPGGRTATLEYMAKIRKKTELFPVGTQFALIEQPYLISNAGEMILSPMIVSVQLRAYLDVDRRAYEARPDATQCVAEFVMQPRQLMKGNAAMRALTPKDFRYEAGSEGGAGFSPYDPFATGDITEGMPATKRLNSCMNCHGGKPGVRTRSFRSTQLFFKESGPDEIGRATVAQKQNDKSWKTLQELWQANENNEGKQSSRPDQALRRSARTDAPSKLPLSELRRSRPSGLQIAQASLEAETETETVDPYDVLYDVIMTRDGRSHAADETGPLIFPHSHFPFDDRTFTKLRSALDAFAALPQAKIEAYSDIKRALLQRHLWKVYDASHPTYYINRDGKPDIYYRNYSDRRSEVRPKIASLIHRLALTKAQILALPNTLTATVKSGRFAESHEPDELFTPFLPPDLYTKESSWICQGDAEDPIPVDVHSKKFKWRSAFLSFLRAPGGRAETLKCVEKFNRGETPPLGTQSALIEQAFLISDEGELVLSPLIVSISLRAYVGEHTRPRRTLRATQCVAEFLMQPRQLMQGNAVMRALTPTDRRFEAGDASGIAGGTQDPFEFAVDAVHPRLKMCMNCHGAAYRIGLQTTRPPLLKDVSPEAIGNATSERKRDHQTWKALHKVWQADSSSRIRENSVEDARLAEVLTNPATHADDQRARDSADPYDVLYDVIMTRYGPDGKAYGADESSPSIFRHSAFPFDDQTYKKLDTALDAFAGLPQEKIEAYSDIKRALMQRHLWHVFDAAVPIRWTEYGTDKVHEYRGTHPDRRDAVRSKIASLIQRLALTKAQILALPDTRAATLESGGFPRRHDSTAPFKPFLPAELSTKESGWVSIGFNDEPPAPRHSKKLKFRSAFLTFMRLPGGRIETLEYIKNGTQDRNNLQHFPAGTQFAFIEQAFLISKEGEMILSLLAVSISLRAYLNVEQGFWKTRPPTQSLAEFVMQPRRLMQGNAVMKALGPTDLRLEAGDVDGFGVASEPFEKLDDQLRSRPRKSMLRVPRLTLCIRCHSERGVDSVGGGAGLFGVKEKSPEEIVQATLAYKREHHTWKFLSELWHADVAVEETQASRPDQAQRRSGNTDAPSKRPLPELRRSAPRSGLPIVQTSSKAETKTTDPYDALYDAIMTRYGPDGKAYGANESSPSIFYESYFPFDDRTYRKLSAALDAFAALPENKIEAHSDVKRALLQRHLWKVFDSTVPRHSIDSRTGEERVGSLYHSERRHAARPKIASLIQRLALTKAEILALPDTRAVTVESGGFPQRHDPDAALKPFLPADLYSKDSSWVGIDFSVDPPAPFHQDKVKFRSAFLTFLRLPGGRTETLEYIARCSEKVEQFPVGTQFALIEHAFLISDEGEMILSPLTVSISLRAYLDVERIAPKLGRAPTQSVAEFVMQPRQLMKGNAVMKALGPRDMRYEAGDVDIHNLAVEPFEDTKHVFYREDTNDMLRRPRLTLCMNCHRQRGRRGVRGGFLSDLKESRPEEIVKATLLYKRDHETWKTLRKLLIADSAQSDD